MKLLHRFLGFFVFYSPYRRYLTTIDRDQVIANLFMVPELWHPSVFSLTYGILSKSVGKVITKQKKNDSPSFHHLFRSSPLLGYILWHLSVFLLTYGILLESDRKSIMKQKVGIVSTISFEVISTKASGRFLTTFISRVLLDFLHHSGILEKMIKTSIH